MVTSNALIPLESGDHLTREEFHRRYCLRTDIRKAELVLGVVYVASPVRAASHGTPQNMVAGWLWNYVATHPRLEAAEDSTVYFDDSEVQPNACLYHVPWTGVGARLTDDGYLEGAPELVVEIAASSAAYDLHDKLEAYRRGGVREYIVWRTLDAQIDWFRLHEGVYVPLEPDARGVIESTVFPGLRLAVAKMLVGDRAGVLRELQRPGREGVEG